MLLTFVSPVWGREFIGERGMSTSGLEVEVAVVGVVGGGGGGGTLVELVASTIWLLVLLSLPGSMSDSDVVNVTWKL